MVHVLYSYQLNVEYLVRIITLHLKYGPDLRLKELKMPILSLWSIFKTLRFKLYS